MDGSARADASTGDGALAFTPGSDAGAFDAGQGASDASTPDASTPDAAASDASVNDDASAPDASTLDAAVPDASSLDASAPDASSAVDAGDAGSAYEPPRVLSCDDDGDGGAAHPCTSCMCTQCEAEIADCADDACSRLVLCGIREGCTGVDECYCGDADSLTCLSAPEGACREVMVEASGLLGTANCSAIDECAIGLIEVESSNPDSPVARATAVDLCAIGREGDPGVPPLIPPTAEIVGSCEAECMP